MTRGGSRAGAGRKPKIAGFDRIALGSACEARFHSLWEAAKQRKLKAMLENSEIPGVRAEFAAIPISERKSFCSSAEGREKLGESEQAIRTARKTPDWVEHTNRVFTVRAPRPKSVTRDICIAIAREFGERWQMDIGERMVRRCWDEYRKQEQRSEAEDI